MSHRHIVELGAPRLTPKELGAAGGGLWYRPGQTFGIEVEFTRPGYATMRRRSWAGFAEHMRRSLARALAAPVSPGRAEESKKDHRRWNVVEDESTGWEISSRILRGVDGFREIAWALDVIRDASRGRFRVDYRTGVHLHLGWKPKSVAQIKRLVRLVKMFEPGLATLVTPSRVASTDGTRYDVTEPNQFCQPISAVFPKRILQSIRTMNGIFREARGQRNVTVNVAPLEQLGTIEVRMLGGTLSAPVVLMWISLWQQILWAASRRDQRPLRCPEDTDVLVPDQDIVALASTHLSPLGRERLHRHLRARRARMVSLWRRHPDLRPWLRFAQGWSND